MAFPWTISSLILFNLDKDFGSFGILYLVTDGLAQSAMY